LCRSLRVTYKGQKHPYSRTSWLRSTRRRRNPQLSSCLPAWLLACLLPCLLELRQCNPTPSLGLLNPVDNLVGSGRFGADLFSFWWIRGRLVGSGRFGADLVPFWTIRGHLVGSGRFGVARVSFCFKMFFQPRSGAMFSMGAPLSRPTVSAIKACFSYGQVLFVFFHFPPAP
jgi:hypothetical protein